MKEDNIVFAQRLHALRVAEGFSSRPALAKAIGVEPNSVYRWESGERAPTYSALKTLANVLKTSASYLIGEIDYPGSLTTVSKEPEREDDILALAPNVAVNVMVVGGGVIEYESMKILTTAGYYPLAKEMLTPFLEEDGIARLRLFKIRGDAMLPRFKDGDYALFKQSFTANDGDNVIVVYKGKPLLRGYCSDGVGGKRLMPSNPAFQPIPIAKESPDVFIQGTVRACIQLPSRDGGFY